MSATWKSLIDAPEEGPVDGEGWGVFQFECLICNHVQAHVFPLPCQYVECTQCSQQHEVRFPNERD